MAGSFGFERDKYEVSQPPSANSNSSPPVRQAPADWLIIANGFSCREQIEQGTERHALHLAEVLQMALNPEPQVPGPHPESFSVRQRESEIQSSMRPDRGRGAQRLARAALRRAGVRAALVRAARERGRGVGAPAEPASGAALPRPCRAARRSAWTAAGRCPRVHTDMVDDDRRDGRHPGDADAPPEEGGARPDDAPARPRLGSAAASIGGAGAMPAAPAEDARAADASGGRYLQSSRARRGDPGAPARGDRGADHPAGADVR